MKVVTKVVEAVVVETVEVVVENVVENVVRRVDVVDAVVEEIVVAVTMMVLLCTTSARCLVTSTTETDVAMAATITSIMQPRIQKSFFRMLSWGL